MSEIERCNNQSVGEEIANSISHGIGVLLAIAGTAVMIVYACLYSNVLGIVSSSIYGFSLIVLYTMSTLYHSITNKRAKKVFQIFDHCSIFLLILGSYAPICLSLIGGTAGILLFSVNLLLTAVGIVLNSISVKKWHKLSLVLYVLMGWSIIFAIKPVINAVPLPGLILVLAGGLSYMIGIIFYKAKKHRFMHSIWHLFVLGGSISQYFFILFYTLNV